MTGPRIPLPDDPSVPKYGTPIDYAVADFAATAMRAERLDPVVTELVRLRCARIHDCRLCRSLRTAPDRLDEETAAKIDHYEASDLPERAKVALRLTDAVILDPAGAGPELRTAAHAHFTPAEIGELLLDVVKWSQQKASVALRIEPPPHEGLSRLRFDASGHPSIGAPLG
ncbi:carboxymuconolactone decarboxylase family protein [Nocardioides nitrophenolicus]|uniref:carboxymuconolactone decarboxylase family protein n=1 Tax=Nocardioides nitrophenolicus TaxID=60489 RepID=UPI001957C0E9|nr:carboxymuconolactone decarboxylase family protein [Nocardioides nitrophenolicus]MBM7516471.1 hypothetical protein [Nocardioides nitrophenolicus]